MRNPKWAYVILVFIVVFFVLFVTVVSVLGVPLWWAFPLKTLSSASLSQLIVQFSPEVPLQTGDLVTLTVINSSSCIPVDGAEITIAMQGLTPLTLMTNSTGQVAFQYAGVITVIQANMDELASSNPIVIPEKPVEWVNSANIAFGSSIAGGFISALPSWLLLSKKKAKARRAPRRAKKGKKEKPNKATNEKP